MEVGVELFLFLVGILMMSVTAFGAFCIWRLATNQKLDPEGSGIWLLVGLAFGFGAGASFVVAAAFPRTRPYSVWLGATLLLADGVRHVVFRRRLKRMERTERPG